MAKNHPLKKKIIRKVEIFLAVNCKKSRLNELLFELGFNYLLTFSLRDYPFFKLKTDNFEANSGSNIHGAIWVWLRNSLFLLHI